MVVPCRRIERITTPKVMVTRSSRCGKSTPRLSTSTIERPPRSPPHASSTAQDAGMRSRLQRSAPVTEPTTTARPSSTAQNAARIGSPGGHQGGEPHLEADEQEDDRIQRERDVLPEGLHGDPRGGRHAGARPVVAAEHARHHRGDDPGEVQMLGDHERPVGGDGRQGDLDHRLVHPFDHLGDDQADGGRRPGCRRRRSRRNSPPGRPG